MSAVTGQVMGTAQQPAYEWKDIPWKQIERYVFKLQKRIYRASVRGDVRAVHRLQRLSMKSWSARALAVRRVTQDNRGKNTAGVDGVKSLNPKQRLRLVTILTLPKRAKQKVRPTRRVWIPKPASKENGNEKRPLGIPTIHNRAEQALAKLALEPEWEADLNQTATVFDQDEVPMMRSQRSSLVFASSRNMCLMRILRNASIESTTKHCSTNSKPTLECDEPSKHGSKQE